MIGLVHYRGGDVNKTKDKLKDALYLYEDFPLVSMDLAKLYLMKEDYDNAIKILNKALAIHSESSEMLALRGKIYNVMGRKKLALKDLKHARKIARFFNEIELGNNKTPM